MIKYILLSIIFSFTLACDVYYNKDLKFDFTDLQAVNLPYGDDGESLYITICSLLNYKCEKSTRLLEAGQTVDTKQPTDVNTVTTSTSDTQTTPTTTATTDAKTNSADDSTSKNTATDTTDAKTVDKNDTENINKTEDVSEKYVIKQVQTDQTQSLIISSKDSCKPYSEQSGVDKEQVQLIEDHLPLKGIILQRRGIVEKDVVSLKLKCSQTEPGSISIIDDEEDQFLFTLSTKSACPILLQNPMIGFYDNFKWMFSVILWVVGIFFLVFGYQLSQLSSIMMATIMGFGFTTIVVGEATLDYDSSGAALCVVIGAGVVVAFIYFNASVSRFFFLLFNFGFSVGVVISLMVQSIFYYSIYTQWMFFPLGTSIIVLGIILGLLGLRYDLFMGIVSTSFVGAYCFIRPWGFILGGYPNELLLTKQAEYGFQIEQNNMTFVYNALVIVLAIICAIYQRKQHLKRVSFDDQLSSDIKYYEMGKVEAEEKQRSSKGSDKNVTVHFAKHLDNQDQELKQNDRYSHITGSDKND